MRSGGYAGHERCRMPSQQTQHGGERELKHAGLFPARQPGSREHERPDIGLAQSPQLDLALPDLLVLGDQNPAPCPDLREPFEVWSTASESLVLYVRDVTGVAQHARNGACRDALIYEELVRVVRQRGRA